MTTGGSVKGVEATPLPALETETGTDDQRQQGIRGLAAAWQRPLFGILGVFALLLVWELLARVGVVDDLLFSRPSAIIAAFGESLTQDYVLNDIRVSAAEMGLGLGAAILIGVPVGIVCGWNKWVFFAVDPWLTILYAMPIVALAPLL